MTAQTSINLILGAASGSIRRLTQPGLPTSGLLKCLAKGRMTGWR
jgi:hypothetical protein